MAVLVLADHDNHALRDTTHRAVTAAGALSSDIDLLVLGQGAGDAAEAAARITGVRKVILIESPELGHGLAEAAVAAILPLMAGYDAVLSPSTTSGKNIAPRLAAKLDVALISDVVEIKPGPTFVRPIYAGNALETLTCADPKIVATIRPTTFAPAAEGGSASVSSGQAVAAGASARFVSDETVKSARPELGAAKVVVSGGRALGSQAEFAAVLEPLADLLGAAIGASRAAVDAGYAPNDYQVGQTGKVVAPSLYIAIGISGAIQHLAGMKDSKVIVAINKDGEAPIFQIADYGLVGDYKTIVPELVQALKAAGL